MTEEFREGFYLDKYGCWQKDRRESGERRNRACDGSGEDRLDRRNLHRRKEDLELLEQEHRAMIDEALDDFAAEHSSKI